MTSFAQRGSGTTVGQAKMTKLDPDKGCASGGYPMTIRGAELGNTKQVLLNGISASDVKATDTTVTCIVPPGPIGQVQVWCEDKYHNKSNTLPFMYLDC